MDGLSWESSPLVSSLPNSWNHEQHEIQASFLIPRSNLGVLTSQVSLPADGAKRLPEDDIFLGKAGAGSSWMEAFNSQSLPSLPRREDGGDLAAAGSLDRSLDCLLSATNSNAESSGEEDGISMILSDCRKLWRFGNSSGVSSGESDTNAASRCSSDHLATRSKQEPERPCPAKRNHDHGGFGVGSVSENPPKPKNPRSAKRPRSSNINFQQSGNTTPSLPAQEPDPEAIAQMKEMIYRAAAFRPVNLGSDLEAVQKPKRKNVRISTDPQTVAARQRRERISERIRVLQRLVPGGNKMDTASVLDEAANYLKFLRSQVKALENLSQHKQDSMNSHHTDFPFSFQAPYPIHHHQC